MCSHGERVAGCRTYLHGPEPVKKWLKFLTSLRMVLELEWKRFFSFLTLVTSTGCRATGYSYCCDCKPSCLFVFPQRTNPYFAQMRLTHSRNTCSAASSLKHRIKWLLVPESRMLHLTGYLQEPLVRSPLQLRWTSQPLAAWIQFEGAVLSRERRTFLPTTGGAAGRRPLQRNRRPPPPLRRRSI